MKKTDYVMAIPIVIGTWIGSVAVSTGILSAIGVDDHLIAVVRLCVIVIGPILGVFLARRAAAHSLMQEERVAELRRRAAEEEHRLREEKSRRNAAEQHAASVHALATRLSGVMADSTRSAETLPTLVSAAENALNAAEDEFEERAFAPFWDAIEQAATHLANFEATVQRLIQSSQFYDGEAPKLDTPPPPFRIGLETLPDASHTADRMRAIARRGQKDFHFATIYEQRKTNQLLIAGFSTLGQAIVELSDRLDSSLDHLSSAVSIGISALATDLTSSQERMASQLTAELARSREQAADGTKAQRAHEREELEMLDNIQRRRRPVPPKFRDGEY